MKKNRSGQAMIEFIFILPILLIILYGIVDLVQVGIIKHSLDSACREGARVAASMPNLYTENTGEFNNIRDIIQSRVNRVLMGSKVLQRLIIQGDVSTPEIDLNSAGTNSIIVVRVEAQYSNMFPFSDRALLTRTVRGEATSHYLL